MPRQSSDPPTMAPWRRRLHTLIFEADTPGGRAFDILLLIAILLSVAAVVLESVESIGNRYAAPLRAVEWFFTAIFTLEYTLRLIAVKRPIKYATSFYGLIDLMAILPTYAALLLPGAQSLMAIRLLRLARVFRIFKLTTHVGESRVLLAALRAARPKITVFLVFVLTVICSIGAVMYVVEGPESGFTSIPESMYWGIVTLTTVGYGDITPQSPFGKFMASLIMILGYGVLAVPTGIVTSELTMATRRSRISTQACPACSHQGHDSDAKHCKYCGAAL
jgi:voltage-gated potassium channel